MSRVSRVHESARQRLSVGRARMGAMLRFGLAVVTLLVATAVAVAGVLIVVPPTGSVDWMLRTAVTEFSLILLLPALLGLVLAWFSGWAGMRRVGLVAAILAGLSVPLALVPAVRGGIAAQERGVRIDPAEYLSGTGLDTVGRADGTRAYGHDSEDSYEDSGELGVWLPEDDPPGRAPVVVNVDDGGFDSWNRWFTDRGYVALDLATHDVGQVTCALGWLRANAAELDVDPDRIVLFGTGTGGWLATLVAYAEDGELPSACPASPAEEADGTRGTGEASGPASGPAQPAAVVALYPPSDHPDRADEPYRHLDAGDPPTLLAHGGQDPVVPATESRRMAAELEVAGVRSRFVEIDYAGHAFDLNWGGFATQITKAEIARFLPAK